MSRPLDLAEIRRYLHALERLKVTCPEEAAEVERALADPLNRIAEYLEPVIHGNPAGLTYFERTWRMAATRLLMHDRLTQPTQARLLGLAVSGD